MTMFVYCANKNGGNNAWLFILYTDTVNRNYRSHLWHRLGYHVDWDACWLWFSSCSEFVWRSQLRNAWPWRSSLIAPRPEMRLEETLSWWWWLMSCLWLCQFALVCLPACYQCLLINSWFSFLWQSVCLLSFFLSVCMGLAVCKIVFLWWTVCLAASPCHQQPSVLIKQLTQQWDMRSKQVTQTSHTRWSVKAVTNKQIRTDYYH